MYVYKELHSLLILHLIVIDTKTFALSSKTRLFCQAFQNMKQKIVIKVQVRCDKCRSKAMKVAAATDGVMSVSLQGVDRDQVVVIGERVDAACLTNTLRKKVGYARLETVEEVKDKPAGEKKDEKKDGDDKKKEGKKDGDGKKDPPPFQCIMPPPCCPPQFESYRVVYEPYGSEPNCTIM
ncbi:hypothetical protein ACB092_06G033300 [Castanea dentata]